MKIISIIKTCSGKHHAWYLTDSGFKIRKPIGDYISNSPKYERALGENPELLKESK